MKVNNECIVKEGKVIAIINLIIIIITALLLNNCNPLNYGKTKTVNLESDEITISFECNEDVVAEWSDDRGWMAGKYKG